MVDYVIALAREHWIATAFVGAGIAMVCEYVRRENAAQARWQR